MDSPNSDYGDGTYIFQDPPLTLEADLDVNGTVLAAGSVVCVDLFLTNELNGSPQWQLDYDQTVLAITGGDETLVSTDFVHAERIDFGPPWYRGLESTDEARIIGSGSKVKLRLEGTIFDSVRIFTDCSS